MQPFRLLSEQEITSIDDPYRAFRQVCDVTHTPEVVTVRPSAVSVAVGNLRIEGATVNHHVRARVSIDGKPIKGIKRIVLTVDTDSLIDAELHIWPTLGGRDAIQAKATSGEASAET